jgi:hypothetical protein
MTFISVVEEERNEYIDTSGPVDGYYKYRSSRKVAGL